LTREAKTSGTAISFNKLTKITPKGLTQRPTNSIHPKLLAIKPYKTPKTIPMMIFQYKGKFFIFC